MPGYRQPIRVFLICKRISPILNPHRLHGVTSILDGRGTVQILSATMTRSPYFVTVKDESAAPSLCGENVRNLRNVLMAIVNYYEDLYACRTGSLHLNGASCRDHMLTSIADPLPIKIR